jgi:hypothetical protein
MPEKERIADSHNREQEARNLETISGEVTDEIERLPASHQAGLPGTRELLIRLQRVIEADEGLSLEDKIDILVEVKILAEAGKDPQAESHQRQAKTAIRILRGTIAELPKGTDFLEVCTTVLPQLSEIFGLQST